MASLPQRGEDFAVGSGSASGHVGVPGAFGRRGEGAPDVALVAGSGDALPASAGAAPCPENGGGRKGVLPRLRAAAHESVPLGAAAGFAVPFAVVVLGGALLLWPGLLADGTVGLGAGLTVVLIGLFISRKVSDHIAAVAFFAGAMTLAAIPPAVAFSGFTTSGTWLVFGGMVLTTAIKELGLAHQLAARILPRSGITYLAAVIGIALIAQALVFIVPSTTARVLLLVPIVIAFAARLGYAPDSRAAAGLVTAAILTTYYGATGVITASLTNLSMVSLADNLYGLPFSYQQYFTAVFPMLGLGSIVLLVICVWFAYREAPTATPHLEPRDRFRRENLQLAPILLVALILWATDSVHGIAPAWVALTAALFCLLGPARKLSLADCVKFEVLILFAAFLSLGVVLDYTETAQWLGAWLVEIAPLSPNAHWTNLAIITAIGTVMSVFTTNLAAPVLYTSLADSLSQATGWPLDTVLLLGTPTWTFIPFVFQAPILVIGMKMAGMPVVGITRFLFGFYFICVPLLVPLHFLWVKYLGYLG